MLSGKLYKDSFLNTWIMWVCCLQCSGDYGCCWLGNMDFVLKSYSTKFYIQSTLSKPDSKFGPLPAELHLYLCNGTLSKADTCLNRTVALVPRVSALERVDCNTKYIMMNRARWEQMFGLPLRVICSIFCGYQPTLPQSQPCKTGYWQEEANSGRDPGSGLTEHVSEDHEFERTGLLPLDLLRAMLWLFYCGGDSQRSSIYFSIWCATCMPKVITLPSLGPHKLTYMMVTGRATNTTKWQLASTWKANLAGHTCY